MRLATRGLTAAVVALAALLSIALLSTTTAALKLLASGATVLVMGGTGHSLSPQQDTPAFVQDYLSSAIGNYVDPASTLGVGIPTGPYNAVGVVTPEEFAPNTGTLTYDQSVALGVLNLDNCIKGTSCNYNTDVGSIAPAIGDAFVVYGFSQSSTIATEEKRALAAEYAFGDGPDVSFVLTANGNRPNGGFLARGPAGVTIPSFLPFGGATFSGPTPTNTQYDTVDIAAQYDGWSDFPVNPLNLLADVNAMMGITYLHLGGTYDTTKLTDPGVIDQGQYGDTHYYLISTPVLPVLMPLTGLPVVGRVLADMLDPTLRVIVESAYDRSTSPGVPTSWKLTYFPNPVKFARDLAVSIPTGLDNGIEDATGTRPFGTTRPGPYGVGGADVTYTTPETAGSTSAAASTPAASATPAADSAADGITASRRSTGSFKPHASASSTAKPTVKPTAAPAAGSDSGSADGNGAGGADTSKPAKPAKPSVPSASKPAKHSGLGSSKRVKASAGSSSD